MKIKRSSLLLAKKIAIRIGIFAGVIAILYGYFGTSLFTITTYDIVGLPEDSKTVVQKELQLIEQKKQFLIIPSNKVLTCNVDVMRSRVIEMFPNTKAVTIRPSGLHTIKIAITQFEPLFSLDETQAITRDGIVYKETRDMSSLPQFIITSSTTRAVTKDGIFSKEIIGLKKEDLVKFSQLIEKIQPVLFPIKKIVLDEDGDVFFYSETGSSTIKFSNSSESAKVWSTFVSAIDTEPLKSKLEKNKDDLVYLDVRFGNKVFYKFAHDSFTKTAGKAIIGNDDTLQATTTLPQ